MKKNMWAAPLIALAVACVAFLSGCGGPSVEELIREDITTGLDAINPENEELLASMDEGADGSFEEMGITTQEFAEAYLGDFKYEIGDITVDEKAGTAEAKVTVYMRSMTDILTEFEARTPEFIASLDPSEIKTEDDFMKAGGQLMMDVVADTEPKPTEVTITYTKDDEGTWQVDGSSLDALVDAMQ